MSKNISKLIFSFLLLYCCSMAREEQDILEKTKEEFVQYFERLEAQLIIPVELVSIKRDFSYLNGMQKEHREEYSRVNLFHFFRDQILSSQEKLLKIFSFIASGDSSFIEPLNKFMCDNWLCFNHARGKESILPNQFDHMNLFFAPFYEEKFEDIRLYLEILTPYDGVTQNVEAHVDRYIFILEEMGKNKDLFKWENLVNFFGSLRNRLYEIKCLMNPENLAICKGYDRENLFGVYRQLYFSTRERFDFVVPNDILNIIMHYYDEVNGDLIADQLAYIPSSNFSSTVPLLFKMGIFKEKKVKKKRAKKLKEKVTHFCKKKTNDKSSTK